MGYPRVASGPLPKGKYLVKVLTRKTHLTAVATKARTSVAKGGRQLLRANAARVGRYRYSTRDGVLKLIPKKAWKASMAKAAAAKAAAAAAASATPNPA